MKFNRLKPDRRRMCKAPPPGTLDAFAAIALFFALTGDRAAHPYGVLPLLGSNYRDSLNFAM